MHVLQNGMLIGDGVALNFPERFLNILEAESYLHGRNSEIFQYRGDLTGKYLIAQ